MPLIAIAAALPQETAPLCAQLGVARPSRSMPWTAATTFDAKHILIGVSGMGTIAMRRLLQSCPQPNVDIWISLGFSGALVDTIAKGEVLVGHRCMGADLAEIETIPPDRIETVSELHFTADNALLHPAQKKTAAERTGAGLVDMEMTAVAKHAAQNSAEFLWIRGISDGLEDRLPFEPGACADADGWPSVWRAMGILMRNPLLLPHMLRLAGDTKTLAHDMAGKTLEILSRL